MKKMELKLNKKTYLIDVLIVTVAVLSDFMSGIFYFASFLLTLPFKEEYNSTVYEASWIGSLQTGFMALFGMPAVMIIETFGLSLPAGFATLVFVCSLIGVTLSNNILITYCLFILNGCALGITEVAAMDSIGIQFNTKRELAFTIYALGGGIGGVAGAGLMAWLLNKVSLNATIYTLAGLGIFILFQPLSYKFLLQEKPNNSSEDRKGHHSYHSHTNSENIVPEIVPVESTIVPIAKSESKHQIQLQQATLPNSNVCLKSLTTKSNSKADHQSKSVVLQYLYLLRDYRVIAFSVATVLQCIAVNTLLILATDLIEEVYSINGLKASYALIGFNAGGLAGKIAAIGATFIQFSRLHASIIIFAVTGIALFFYPHINYISVCVLCSLFGMSLGYYTSVYSQVLVEIFGRASLSMYIGIAATTRGIGLLIGAPLASILQENYSYTEAFCFGGASLTLAVALLTMVAIYERLKLPTNQVTTQVTWTLTKHRL